MSSVEAGYFVVELEQFKVAFNDAIEESPQFRVDLELVGGEDSGIRWSSNSTALSSTPESTGFLEPKEESAPEGEGEGEGTEEGKEEVFGGSVCTVGCNHFQRTEFIDMTDEMISKFMNSSLKISIVTIGKAVEAKKGAPTEPSDTSLADVYFPLASLVKGNQTFVESSASLQELQQVQSQTVLHETIHAALSSVVVRLSLDNGFAEYIAGGNVIQWAAASFKNLPLSWTIPLVDPAAAGKKAPPPKKGAAVATEEELREASLALIAAALPGQGAVAAYTMTISPDTPPESGSEDTPAPTSAGFQSLTLTGGKLMFDSEAAASAPASAEEPVETLAALWSVAWGPSAMSFVHRSNAKALSSSVSNGEINFSVAITRSSLDGSSDEDLKAVGQLDGSVLNVPQEKTFTFSFEATGSEDVTAECSATMSCENAIVTPNPFAESSISPVDVISLKSVSLGGAGNRDVKKELRQEIADIVKEISQEYVGLYPQPPAQPLTSHSGLSVAAPGLEDISIEARKAHFMHYLSTHGVYHRFKEVLKPRIQRYARERYGARNRAMGKSGPYVDSAGYSEADKVPLDDMISELYVLLTRECNTVLNAMYKSTIIDRDTQELEKMPLIDDEVETPKQKFMRLHKLARDAAADSNHERAEQFHLERIQMVAYEVTLKTDTLAPHHAFFQYYDYLIRRSASELMAFRNSERYASLSEADKGQIPSVVESLRDKARQALESSNQLRKDDWMTMMQMGLLFLESNHPERAGECLLASVHAQLNSQKNKSGGSDVTLEDFQGYESDQIVPVHPLTYIALSLYYTQAESALEARKAVRLAVRSYAEGDYSPPVSEHGKPKKTAVLCMSQAAIFMFHRGWTTLGDLCTQFAVDCDDAVNRKATERNLAFDTVPAITHLLKQAKTYQHLYQGQSVDALKVADESVAVSQTLEHKVKACMTAIEGVAFAFPDGCDEEKKSWFSRALGFINSEDAETRDYECIPLSGYVEIGKLLVQQNKFEEALNAMLFGCNVYPSSTLFNLVGICCLRLDRLQDAEDALQEANLIDNRNPNVWAYLCVLCLHGGSQRMAEAEKSLAQALRLGLTNTAVLREMATSYIAVDKLQTAEDLIRRALANDDLMGKSNPHTRRLLGDVLAGQNNAAQAIDEYQSVIEDPTADKEARILAGEQCVQLLQSLGRTEERRTLEEILEALECGEA
jgi:tetratricopeptide (TPR) repeat protein